MKPKLVSILLLAVLLAGLTPATPVHALTVRYAKASGLTSGLCTSWASACDLPRALSVAVSGDQVWVRQGVYLPTTTDDRSAAFLLIKNGVAIYGGFLGNETLLSERDWKNNTTVLSGDIGTPGIATDNIYNVVITASVDGTAILDGFTITAGYAETDGVANGGAGVLVYGGAAPRLRNLVITGNTAKYGAGMAVIGSSSPVLTNVVFTSNVSVVVGGVVAGGGGGMSVNHSTPVLNNVSFIANRATLGGGGMFNENGGNAKLINVRFSSNQAINGGGMYNDSSSPRLTNVIFAGNRAESWGGGLYNDHSSPSLMKVTFSANSAMYGGGISTFQGSNARLTNVTFNGNTADVHGGAIFNFGSSPVLKYVTIAGNQTPAGQGGGLSNFSSSQPQVLHSILWGNAGGQYINATNSTGVIKNSIVAGASCPAGATCTNRINQNPMLAALANNGGFTQTMALKPGSPAINRIFCLSGVATDQRGVARPQGVRCDIGGYEFIP